MQAVRATEDGWRRARQAMPGVFELHSLRPSPRARRRGPDPGRRPVPSASKRQRAMRRLPLRQCFRAFPSSPRLSNGRSQNLRQRLLRVAASLLRRRSFSVISQSRHGGCPATSIVAGFGRSHPRALQVSIPPTRFPRLAAHALVVSADLPSSGTRLRRFVAPTASPAERRRILRVQGPCVRGPSACGRLCLLSRR